MEALQNVRRFCHRPGGALLAAALLAAAMMSVGLGVSGYGFAVFVFSPFVAGFVAAELYEGPRSGSWFFLIALSQGALLSVGVLVLFLGVEGLICIAMKHFLLPVLWQPSGRQWSTFAAGMPFPNPAQL